MTMKFDERTWEVYEARITEMGNAVQTFASEHTHHALDQFVLMRVYARLFVLAYLGVRGTLQLRTDMSESEMVRALDELRGMGTREVNRMHQIIGSVAPELAAEALGLKWRERITPATSNPMDDYRKKKP